MAHWIKLLKPQDIVNGRLIMCQCKTNAHYQYLIFPTEVRTFENESKIIKSGYNYTSWKAAMSAGRKAVEQSTGNSWSSVDTSTNTKQLHLP